MTGFVRDVSCLWFAPDADAVRPPGGTPAILFLHGVGERGSGGEELTRVRDWGLPKFRAGGRRLLDGPFPFLVIAPQCPPDRTWCDDDVLQALDDLVEEIARTDGTDANRLHVSGFSMGGIGAFCVALRQPARFASLSSVCGRCPAPDALPALAELPAWIAFAENDEITELTNGSKDAIRRLAKYGNLTEMPYRLERRGERGPHVLTCDAAYAEPGLYQWLFALRRRAV